MERDAQPSGTAIACGNKREVRRRLRDLSREIGAHDPRRLGDRLALLIDGAYGHATTLGAARLKRELIETARLLIDAQVSSTESCARETHCTARIITLDQAHAAV